MSFHPTRTYPVIATTPLWAEEKQSPASSKGKLFRQTLTAILLTTCTLTTQAQIRLAPGDDKTGYESKDYTTNSLSLEYRNGQAADLKKIANTQQLGLPNPATVHEHSPDSAAIALGRKLFFDRRLSRNRTMSCAMCHIPEQGFTSNELKRPIGFEGRALKRNAPTLLNVIYNQHLFVDARESSLAQQVWSPLLAANEMNNPSVGFVVDQISADSEYLKLFNDAFGSAPDMLNIGIALAQYQQSLIAGNSPFDRWKYGTQSNAMNAQQQRGFELFVGKAACVSCHTIGTEYATFSDDKLHNTGVGYQYSMQRPMETVSVQLAPGVSANVAREIVDQVGESKANDLGRYEVTLDPDDRWRYRTPSLRNVALTAPYMHNGEFLTLSDVVKFYNAGGVPHELLSPLMRPLGLNVQEQVALVAFLKALTGSTVTTLVADAFAAPVSDTNEH